MAQKYYQMSDNEPLWDDYKAMRSEKKNRDMLLG